MKDNLPNFNGLEIYLKLKIYEINISEKMDIENYDKHYTCKFTHLKPQLNFKKCNILVISM